MVKCGCNHVILITYNNYFNRDNTVDATKSDIGYLNISAIIILFRNTKPNLMYSSINSSVNRISDKRLYRLIE